VCRFVGYPEVAEAMGDKIDEFMYRFKEGFISDVLMKDNVALALAYPEEVDPERIERHLVSEEYIKLLTGKTYSSPGFDPGLIAYEINQRIKKVERIANNIMRDNGLYLPPVVGYDSELIAAMSWVFQHNMLIYYWEPVPR